MCGKVRISTEISEPTKQLTLFEKIHCKKSLLTATLKENEQN